MSTLWTLQNVIINYQQLSNEDATIRQNANIFLINVVDNEEAWSIAQKMVSEVTNISYQLLGAHILYQKIDRELHNLDVDFKNKLKEFIFTTLNNEQINDLPLIDRLASCGALIACSLFLDNWQSLIEDLVSFMSKGSSHLRKGLIILERIPEELRITNRISHQMKNVIQESFLKKQELIANVFLSVFQLNELNANKHAIKTLESWIKLSFSLMKYPTIVDYVLAIILHGFEELEVGCKVICETLQATSRKKFQTLAEVDPIKERQAYSENQLTSFRSILSFLFTNKENFFNNKNSSTENLEIFTQIIKEILLSYGFMLLEDLGFQLIMLIFNTFLSNDLKLSYSTFQFWIDFSEKIYKMKLPVNIDSKLWMVMQNVFENILKKTILSGSFLLEETDLKQDETVDDSAIMSFNQYRKQSSNLLKFFYEFFSKKHQEEGTKMYLNKLLFLIDSDVQKQHCDLGMELAIYCLKSAVQSMVSKSDTNNIIVFVDYLIKAENTVKGFKVKYVPIPPRIASETMSLIQVCTREIKEQEALFIQCLKYCLNYVEDEYLCHHSATCFQIMMETVTKLTDSGLVQNLIDFYQQKQFTKQIILEKIFEGILSAITKLTNEHHVSLCLSKILKEIQRKYIEISNNNKGQFLFLIEIKTLLDSYESSQPNFKKNFKTQFVALANQGVYMINRIMFDGLNRKIKYTPMNELALSVSVCKNALKICEGVQLMYINMQGYIELMNLVLRIMHESLIDSYCPLLVIICQTLNQFMDRKVPEIDQWLSQNLPFINAFFLKEQLHQDKINSVDTDIIKWYYHIQEALILYNSDIYLAQPEHLAIFRIAVYALRHFNQKNMQRKILNYLFLCSQMKNAYVSLYSLLFQNLFASIPIINSMCFVNVGKIFMTIFSGIDMKTKQTTLRGLLEYPPYKDVDVNIKQILGKFLAFAIQSKIDRYIKGVLVDLLEISTKRTSMDSALSIQLRFSAWKRQFNKNAKNATLAQQ